MAEGAPQRRAASVLFVAILMVDFALVPPALSTWHWQANFDADEAFFALLAREISKGRYAPYYPGQQHRRKIPLSWLVGAAASLSGEPAYSCSSVTAVCEASDFRLVRLFGWWNRGVLLALLTLTPFRSRSCPLLLSQGFSSAISVPACRRREPRRPLLDALSSVCGGSGHRQYSRPLAPRPAATRAGWWYCLARVSRPWHPRHNVERFAARCRLARRSRLSRASAHLDCRTSNCWLYRLLANVGTYLPLGRGARLHAVSARAPRIARFSDRHTPLSS